MLAVFGAKPVAEPDEAPGLGSGGRVQHLDQRALDNLVFQRGDAERALPPVGPRDEPTPRRLRPIGSSVDSAVQIHEANLEVMAVILPRHAIDARSRLALERQVGFPELIAIDVVQERGEPFLLLQPCALPYAFQAVGRAVPARCPGRAVLLRVLLGPRPWLHELLGRSPGLVARFTATMAESDPSPSFIIGFGSSPSRCGPLTSRAAKVEVSRFPVEEFSYMPGSSTTRDRRASPFCLPLMTTASASQLILSRLSR